MCYTKYILLTLLFHNFFYQKLKEAIFFLTSNLAECLSP
jgi:hypothetical protein